MRVQRTRLWPASCVTTCLARSLCSSLTQPPFCTPQLPWSELTQSLFEVLDESADGSIDFREFASGTIMMQGEDDSETLRFAFRALDRDVRHGFSVHSCAALSPPIFVSLCPHAPLAPVFRRLTGERPHHRGRIRSLVLARSDGRNAADVPSRL